MVHMTDGNRALVEHLATRVMGWRVFESLDLWHTAGCPGRCTIWQDGFLYTADRLGLRVGWNPLDSWADAGALLENLQQRETNGDMEAFRVLREVSRRVFIFSVTPRAVSEAIGRATGFEE